MCSNNSIFHVYSPLLVKCSIFPLPRRKSAGDSSWLEKSETGVKWGCFPISDNFGKVMLCREWTQKIKKKYIQTSSSKWKANYNVQVLDKVIIFLFFTEKDSIFPCTKLRKIQSQVPKVNNSIIGREISQNWQWMPQPITPYNIYLCLIPGLEGGRGHQFWHCHWYFQKWAGLRCSW